MGMIKICMKNFYFLFIALVLIQCSKNPASVGNIESIEGTSTSKYGGYRYHIENLLDNNPGTSWCEGTSDEGVGESISIDFRSIVEIESILISNGLGDKKYFPLNNRVRILSIKSGDKTIDEITLSDQMEMKLYNFKKIHKLKNLTMTINSVYKGSGINETCLSEISFPVTEEARKKRYEFKEGNLIDKDSGKEVVVRINNRGPFIKGRVIDLSYAAAQKLDIVDKGITPCKITILKTPGK